MNSERYNVSTLGQFVGQELGVSDWLTVDQERINEFADCTGDHQWIHVDVERAQRESPLGSTITHGYLTLSLLAAMQMELGIVPEGVTQALNYGLDRVRFMAPVKAGARIRTRAGIPGQLVDLRIVDDEMQDVPHDGKSSGEVVVRAPWLTQGYLNDPINSENLWRGGYLHTNDIGTIDPEGYLLITDRIKDVVKSGGEWISSLVLEDIISQYPGVSEVAVIGIADEKWGERPLALVVLKQESVSAVTDQHVQAHVKAWAERGVISKWAVPEVRFVDYLEKTSVGKLDKKVLRQKHG